MIQLKLTNSNKYLVQSICFHQYFANLPHEFEQKLKVFNKWPFAGVSDVAIKDQNLEELLNDITYIIENIDRITTSHPITRDGHNFAYSQTQLIEYGDYRDPDFEGYIAFDVDFIIDWMKDLRVLVQEAYNNNETIYIEAD